jgi:hypothetical protein
MRFLGKRSLIGSNFPPNTLRVTGANQGNLASSFPPVHVRSDKFNCNDRRPTTSPTPSLSPSCWIVARTQAVTSASAEA